MIEKKTLWAVTKDLEVNPKTVIVEDGNVLACKNTEDEDYDGTLWNIRKMFDTEEKALAYAKQEEQQIRDMVPKVREFIDRMSFRGGLLKKLGIKKKDYLGNYAGSSSSYYKEYRIESDYSEKLEVFVRSRMLNIGGWMLPVDDVKRVQWFFHNEDGEECDDFYWLAKLTMADGTTVNTGSEVEVRLVKAVFGKNSGIYYIDNDFNYDEDEEED